MYDFAKNSYKTLLCIDLKIMQRSMLITPRPRCGSDRFRCSICRVSGSQLHLNLARVQECSLCSSGASSNSFEAMVVDDEVQLL